MNTFWFGFGIATLIHGIGWLVWYLAPLGDPETGTGRIEMPMCERPQLHAGVNAAHRAFMDRLTCHCAACVYWRKHRKC